MLHDIKDSSNDSEKDYESDGKKRELKGVWKLLETGLRRVMLFVLEKKRYPPLI